MTSERPTSRPSGARPAHTLSGWRRRLVTTVSERLLLKVTAVALSVILWFIITVKEPAEPGEHWVAASFDPVLDTSLVIINRMPRIIVNVVGSPTDRVKLEARPPVIRPRIDATSPDTVVLELRPSDVQVPDGIRVERIDPATVTLQFEPMWTRTVPVRSMVRVTVPDGSRPMPVAIEPESVEISGPRLVVLRTEYVNTEATVLAYDDSLPHLIAIDTAGLQVRPRPTQVKARILFPAESVGGRFPGDVVRRQDE